MVNHSTQTTYKKTIVDVISVNCAKTKFKQLIDNELVNIHEGNITRYQVTLPEYKQWYAIWSQP